MKRLQQLTSGERDKITILQSEGLSVRKIAKELGRSPSTNIKKIKQKRSFILYRSKYIGSQTDKKVKEK